jgi:hypothetical protein
VVEERELEGQPAELLARVLRRQDEVGLVGGNALPALDPHTLAGVDLLELDTELQLDIAATPCEIDADLLRRGSPLEGDPA